MKAPAQIKATVIGFAREDCPICLGRGRDGWDVKYSDKAHIIPCRCVEFFDLDTVKKSFDDAQKAQQEAQDAAFKKQMNEAPLMEHKFNCGITSTCAARMDPGVCPEHGESCGIVSSQELPQTPSSSSSPSDSSNSSSSDLASSSI